MKLWSLIDLVGCSWGLLEFIEHYRIKCDFVSLGFYALASNDFTCFTLKCVTEKPLIIIPILNFKLMLDIKHELHVYKYLCVKNIYFFSVVRYLIILLSIKQKYFFLNIYSLAHKLEELTSLLNVNKPTSSNKIIVIVSSSLKSCNDRFLPMAKSLKDINQ